MFERIIEVENEVEFLSTKKLLETNEIPVLINQTNDSSFPGLNNLRNTYQLIIPEEFSSKYFKLTDKDYPTTIIEKEKTTKKPKTRFWLNIMIVYGLVMSLLFLKFFDTNRKLSSQKNFDYQWNALNTELSLLHKKTQNIVAVYVDNNFDLNSERLDAYSNGKLISKSFDSDENGIYEEIIFFDLQGNDAGTSLDQNQNGLLETFTIVLENGEVMHFEDQNENGLYELN